MASLRTVMQSYFKGVKVDKGLVQRVAHFHNTLVNRDDDSISFFGDALWGVYPIYFTNSDVNTWFDDVIDVDDIGLKREVHELEAIVVTRQVSSDIVNLTLLYVTHLAVTSNTLSVKEREVLIKSTIGILHIKFLSSLQSHRFKYKADKSIALAVYAQLSRRFDIKVHGSWGALIKARAVEITDQRALHRRTLERFGDDDDVVYMVNDIQGRIREIANKLTEEFHRLHDDDTSIGTNAKLIMGEDGERIADSFNEYASYRDYLSSVVADRESLIRPELTNLIKRALGRVPDESLVEALTWLSDNHRGRENKAIEGFLDNVLGHAFTLIDENNLKTNQLAAIISKLRSAYLSSRTKDDRLTEAKEVSIKFIKKAVTSRNPNVHVTIRTGVMLYLVLRGLSKNYYS